MTTFKAIIFEAPFGLLPKKCEVETRFMIFCGAESMKLDMFGYKFEELSYKM
jgi:hypothetical protein